MKFLRPDLPALTELLTLFFAAIATILFPATAAHAQGPAKESVIFTFANGTTTGEYPQGSLIMDASGNLYGTTFSGGAYISHGTVFELSPAANGTWTEKLLYSFGATATDASGPISSLVFDSKGNLYGTTQAGGVNGNGAVFELSPATGGAWTEQVLWSFDNNGVDGIEPSGGLVLDAKGNLYGTTFEGGNSSSSGIVFELSPETGGTWKETILYNFGGFTKKDGANPHSSLVWDAAGNLYGTTQSSGPSTTGSGSGTIFELIPGSSGAWTEKILYSFQGGPADGAEPIAGITFDSLGNIYGATYSGGANQEGIVYELTQKSGVWSETILHSFGIDSSTDGWASKGTVTIDAAGNLFTTVTDGGTGSNGAVVKLSPVAGGGYTEELYHDFGITQGDSGSSQAGLFQDPSGNLFGTSPGGTVFEIAPLTPIADTPTFSLASGTYTGSEVISILDASAAVTIYYTTDGTTPTAASTKYTGAFLVSSTETIKAIAVGTGYEDSEVATATYTIQAANTAAPVFSPAVGTYATAQKVTLTDATAGAVIYFTTNGTTPTTASTKYTAAITVSATETIEAIAVATGHPNSVVVTGKYIIATPTATPTFSKPAGSYAGAQTITLADTTAGAVIYYTTNGTTPTAASTKYAAAITVSATETIEAIAIATGFSSSAVATAKYTIEPLAATPTFSLAAGTYTTAQALTLKDATAAAVIYYTTNGTTPTTASTKYTAAIEISVNETVKAIAVATGYSNSLVATSSYIIAPYAATPVFSTKAGTYEAVEDVAITDATAGAAIYYTTNGTTPTTASPKYTSPIPVTATATLKAIATATGHTESAMATAAYTIVATPSALIAPATAIGTPDATLNALVNPQGLTGTYQFQYGTSTTAFTTVTPATALAAATAPVAASAKLTTLKTKTVYYYRVVVTTAAGSSTSAIASFTTN